LTAAVDDAADARDAEPAIQQGSLLKSKLLASLSHAHHPPLHDHHTQKTNAARAHTQHIESGASKGTNLSSNREPLRLSL
jgi:hypothetical protein